MTCVVGGVMKRLVEFQLDQGGSVLVEVDEPSGGPVVRGDREGPLRLGGEGR